MAKRIHPEELDMDHLVAMRDEPATRPSYITEQEIQDAIENMRDRRHIDNKVAHDIEGIPAPGPSEDTP